MWCDMCAWMYLVSVSRSLCIVSKYCVIDFWFFSSSSSSSSLSSLCMCLPFSLSLRLCAVVVCTFLFLFAGEEIQFCLFLRLLTTAVFGDRPRSFSLFMSLPLFRSVNRCVISTTTKKRYSTLVFANPKHTQWFLSMMISWWHRWPPQQQHFLMNSLKPF